MGWCATTTIVTSVIVGQDDTDQTSTQAVADHILCRRMCVCECWCRKVPMIIKCRCVLTHSITLHSFHSDSWLVNADNVLAVKFAFSFISPLPAAAKMKTLLLLLLLPTRF